MNFKERYKHLNQKQREAVDTIYGPLLVLAGPGSGKTELLSMRIANILQKTDANPSNILCLTFTENAAKNMRERLRTIIGYDAYKVAIHTFHSFGQEILNRFSYLGNNDEVATLEEIECSEIFETILQELPWNHPWKNSDRSYELKENIRLLKEADITPTDFKAILLLNEQFLNDICPIIEKYLPNIFPLGRKKEEKEKNIALFETFIKTLTEANTSSVLSYKNQETLAATILRSLKEASDARESFGDSKPITRWKNTWLEKHVSGWRLKDATKREEFQGLLTVYTSYQEALEKKKRIDFADMILRAHKLLQTHPSVRSSLAELYQWIMIDEYQDTNDAQLHLITTLIQESVDAPNIFAVGDDDQSIYKFQGANTKNIRFFHEHYPETQLILLDKNYRSKEEIVHFSREIMDKGPQMVSSIFPGEEKKFEAVQGVGGRIVPLEFETEYEELCWVANDIEQKIQTGTPHGEIAVIARTNDTLERIGKILMTKNIPLTLSKDENIFENEAVHLLIQILSYLRSLQEIGHDRDDLLLEILAHPMWNIDRLTLWEISRTIFRARKEEKKIWIEMLSNHSDEHIATIATFLKELSLRASWDRLEDSIDIITGIHSIELPGKCLHPTEHKQPQMNLALCNESQTFQSPFYTYFFNEASLHKNPTRYIYFLSCIKKFIESLREWRKNKGWITLTDFTEYIGLIQKYTIPLFVSVHIGNADGVQCITAHKAKGLEYQVVYAISLTENKYNNKRGSRSSFPSNLILRPEKDNDDDVRRLIYTICTRAKDTLILTTAKIDWNEKHATRVSSLAHVENWTFINEKVSDLSIASLFTTDTRPLVMVPYTQKESSFLQEYIFKNFTLSVTALQNFLDVTQGGPENFLQRNILRFPEAQSPHALYGTALHAGLEACFKEYTHTGNIRKESLWEGFRDSIQQQGCNVKDEKNLLEKGKENIRALFTHIKDRTYGKLQLEYRFNGVQIPLREKEKYIQTSERASFPIPETIPINGMLDRIEICPDNTLIITDYKTGKGFESFDGSADAIKKWKYQLQLTFYALLFQYSPSWKAYSQKKYQLFFVDPDKKEGNFYEPLLYIQQGEQERLERLICAVMMKIYTLDFPDISAYKKSITGIRQFEEDLLSHTPYV